MLLWGTVQRSFSIYEKIANICTMYERSISTTDQVEFELTDATSLTSLFLVKFLSVSQYL